MSSIPAYYEDTYRFSDIAKIESAGSDERGDYLILDKTIFYPQGGGQPADRGSFNLADLTILIHAVKSFGKEVRHYTDRDYKELIGKNITQNVDSDKRVLHAKLHSSGHLISNVVEEIYPKYRAVKGHHFPGECFVEFVAKNGVASSIDLTQVSQRLDEVISKNKPLKTLFITSDQLGSFCPDLPYSIPSDQAVRLVCIEDFPYQPCGGTHVNATGKLKGLKVDKFKVKSNTLKIYYSIDC